MAAKCNLILQADKAAADATEGHIKMDSKAASSAGGLRLRTAGLGCGGSERRATADARADSVPKRTVAATDGGDAKEEDRTRFEGCTNAGGDGVFRRTQNRNWSACDTYRAQLYFKLAVPAAILLVIFFGPVRLKLIESAPWYKQIVLLQSGLMRAELQLNCVLFVCFVFLTVFWCGRSLLARRLRWLGNFSLRQCFSGDAASRTKPGSDSSHKAGLFSAVASKEPVDAPPSSNVACNLCFLGAGISIVAVLAHRLQHTENENLKVFLYGLLTCMTTGLGGLPLMFVCETVDESAVALANAGASGMMLAAAAGMLLEAHEHCGPGDWQIFAGLLAGCLFIRCSQLLCALGDWESEIAVLHDAIRKKAHFRRAILIFVVMFCHSAAEGIAVGVAFSRQLRDEFGFYISLLLAVHNVPEGLAIALVLVPRGVSVQMAALAAVMTSVPQPFMALISFVFVDVFQGLLPLGLSAAAGAMIFVSFCDLLGEAVDVIGWKRASVSTAGAFVAMCLVMMYIEAAIQS